jgi:hypothetical protein
MPLPKFALLLLSASTLGLCQQAEEWPRDAASAAQGPGRYNFTYEILLERKVRIALSLMYFCADSTIARIFSVYHTTRSISLLERRLKQFPS